MRCRQPLRRRRRATRGADIESPRGRVSMTPTIGAARRCAQAQAAGLGQMLYQRRQVHSRWNRLRTGHPTRRQHVAHAHERRGRHPTLSGPLRVHAARQVHHPPVFFPDLGRHASHHIGRHTGHISAARPFEREMRCGGRLVLGCRVRPVGHLRLVPFRTQASAMGIGVLHDEAQHAFGRLHRDMQAHRRAVVVQVDVARPDRQPLQQLQDRFTEYRKRR